MDAQTLAMLRALEERITTITELLTDPEGRVQQAQNDTLRIYGDTAQLREVFSLMRDQQMALADATAILVGRFIEHDKRVSAQHAEMLHRLETLATGVGQAEIAAQAAEARAVLHAAEEERLAELAHAADRAAELLSVARMDEIGVVRAAVKRARAEIAKAAEANQAELGADADTARGVVADAAEQARETLHQEAEHEQPE